MANQVIDAKSFASGISLADEVFEGIDAPALGGLGCFSD
jgi:hypothetical protein